MSGSVGFVHRPRPFESLSPLSPLICDVFDIFNRYGYHYPYEYPYPHETGATEESAFQLNCRFALRPRVDLGDAAAAESTDSRRHVDGATLQLQGQQGTGTWLPRY